MGTTSLGRFYCGIHRDSSLSLDEHFTHFNALQDIYQEVSNDTECHYLGRRPARIWNLDTPFQFSGSSMPNVVRSEETAVHVGWMREVIPKAIERNPEITAFTRHEVDHVEHAGQSFVTGGTDVHGAWKTTTDIVVNCLWEGKHRIDNIMHGNHASNWITRVKYGFVLDSIPELRTLPSLIITHGPFGDIVNYSYDNTIYVTWYPSCLVYLDQTERLPDVWDAACDGVHPPDLVEGIFKESIETLSEYVPALRTLKLKQIMAGSIMGRGKTDISDLESGLHRRHGIGVEVTDGYYSIFTGKYTCGPANAIELRELLA